MFNFESRGVIDLYNSNQSPEFQKSSFLMNSIRKSQVQYGNYAEKKEIEDDINEWNPEQKEKLKGIIKKIQRMKDERRANNLVRNLPTRMLKSFNQNKFDLLNDKSFYYDEHQYQDSINKYIADNSLKNQFKTKLLSIIERNNLGNDLSKSKSIERSKNYEDKDTVLVDSQIQTKKRTLSQGQSIYFSINKRNIITLINILRKVFDQIPIVQPSSPLKLIWDLAHMIIIIMCLFFLPITIVFNLEYCQLFSRQILFIIPTFLTLDILINLNTGYFYKGQVVKNRFKIINKYFRKKLLLDIISIFPFVISLYNEFAHYQCQQSDDSDNSYQNSYNFSKMILLPFFLKSLSLSSTLRKIEERFNLSRFLTNIIQLTKLLFTIIMINHLFACLWVYASHLELQAGYTSTWMVSKGYQTCDWARQYLAAFYFTTVTMITVGYGDILPQNEIEQILCVITMMLACGVFGYSLNEVGQIFSNFFQVDNEIKKNLTIVQRFMSKKNINQKLQFQVREYLEYYWRESVETNQEQENDIINQLSESLRQKLLFEANKIVLKDSQIFNHNFSKIVIEQTVPLIQEIKYSPESLICQKGIQDDCAIYFIENGSVDIVLNLKQKKSQQLFRLRKGDTFGAHTFFTGLPRMNNVRSNEFTTVLKIRRQDFLQLVQQYPEDHETFCSIRDQISYLNDYSKIELKCKSCNSSHHMVNDCQYLHLVPNKARIIKRFNDFNNIFQANRIQFNRRSENPNYHYKSSRAIYAEVQKQNQIFIEHNDTIFNLSEDETQQYSDGYFNQESDKEREKMFSEHLFDNVIKESENESSRDYKFTKKNTTLSKFGQDHNNENLVYDVDKQQSEFGKSPQNKNIFSNFSTSQEQEENFQKRHSHISKMNNDSYVNQASRIRSFTERSENIQDNVSFNQINSIQMNDYDALNHFSQNRKKSITIGFEDNKAQDKQSKQKSLVYQNFHSTISQQNKRPSMVNFADDPYDSNTPTQKVIKQYSSNDFKKKIQASHLMIKSNTKDENQNDNILKQIQLLLIQNQQNQFQDNHMKEGFYLPSEIDSYDIFYYFDKMKQFVKYNPRFNFSSVISRYNQLIDAKKKKLKVRKNNRFSRVRNTNISKTQIKLLDLSQSLLDRKISKAQQTSSQNQNTYTNNIYENTDNMNNKKCNNTYMKQDTDQDLTFKQNNDLTSRNESLNQSKHGLVQYSPMNSQKNTFKNGFSQQNFHPASITQLLPLDLSKYLSEIPKKISMTKYQTSNLENYINVQEINKDDSLLEIDHGSPTNQVMPNYFNKNTSNLEQRTKIDIDN